jgi:DNA-binding ferritin-like protein
MYGKFIGNLLHSATVAHIMHFRVEGEGSYAKHIALATYYDSIVELIDAVAESIQGSTGELIKDYPNTYTTVSIDPVDYMASLKQYVTEARAELPQDSNIQNEVDNIVTLIDSTLYKLIFLR